MAIKSQKQRARERKRAEQNENAKLNSLPNTYKFAAEALKTMSERGGSAGSIVVGKYKSYNYKHIFALVMNTAKNIKIIKKIIHEVKLAKKVPEDNPFLLEILVGDMLFGKGLKSIEQNSLAAAIIGLKDSIVKQQNLLKKDYAAESTDTVVAKYLKINHIKSNMEHVISQLKTLGLKQLEYSKEKIKFKKFINKFKSMENNEFMLDFHYPNDLIVLKLAGADKLKKLDLLKKGKAMLQDKASFMAVEALGVQPNAKVIDACCAPGLKTALIANKMKNKGKILAFDVDKKRLISAIHLLKVQGITCAKAEVHDFSKVKLKRLLKTHNLDSFDSILIDPSCSGSGIRSRVDYKSSNEEIGRLKKLRAFQVALLKHALRANVSKTIVYCTCSTSVEENEQVIEMALNESGVKTMWDVVDVLPFWLHRGESNYEFGNKCLRSDENDLTNGFFVAKLQRNQTKSIQTADDDEPSNGKAKKVGEAPPAKDKKVGEASPAKEKVAPKDEEADLIDAPDEAAPFIDDENEEDMDDEDEEWIDDEEWDDEEWDEEEDDEVVLLSSEDDD